MRFVIGLIVICFVAAFCVELNLWLLGGMFTEGGLISGGEAISAREALNMIYADEDGLAEFIDMVDNKWYFLWALLAVAVNAKLLSETHKFASWFSGDFKQSVLGDNLFTFGKSAATYIVSAHKKTTLFAIRGAKRKKEDGKPTFIERIRSLGNRKAET
jgi:hypothetical protein